MTPSQIGVLLRDNHGVAQVNSVTNSKILRILKGQGLAPALPEDLYCLCLLYTSPSPRDGLLSRMPSSA